MGKLTGADESALLADYAAGELTIAEIGRRYGVDETYPTLLAKRRGAPMRGYNARHKLTSPPAAPVVPGAPSTPRIAFQDGR